MNKDFKKEKADLERREYLEKEWNDKENRKFRKFLKNEGFSEKEIRRRFESMQKWRNYENNTSNKSGEYIGSVILSYVAFILSLFGGLSVAELVEENILTTWVIVFNGLLVISFISIVICMFKLFKLEKEQEDYQTELLLEDSK